MPNLFVSLIAITPKLVVVTPTATSLNVHLGQNGARGFGGLFNELEQRKFQTPGSK